MQTHLTSAKPSTREFADRVSEASSAALDVAGAIHHDYSIGGRTVRLSFAGPALVPALTPSLEHLRISDSSAPELTVRIWDSESTGVAMPYVQMWNDCTDRGAVRCFEGSGISATRLQTSAVCSLVDGDSAVYWAASVDDVPFWESGAPFRALLHAWWRNHHGMLLHAGAVGTNGAGIMLIGKGGSGKSTTALACMTAGMQYISDDYCLVTQEPGLSVHSVYCSAKLRGQDGDRFPALAPLLSNASELGEEKAICFLASSDDFHLAKSLDLRAVLMPRVTGLRETRLTPASPIEALRSLAPSAIFQLPEAGPLEFTRIGQIVRQIPCFWLDCGTDLDLIPDVVKEAISSCLA